MNLSLAGRFTQSWMPWNSPPAIDQLFRRRLDVQDAGAGGHPLGGTVLDHAAAAVAVLVQERSVDHVGHRLEATVRVPGRPARFQGRVVDLAHLIHVDERVQIGLRHPGEGAHDRKALAFEALRTSGDGADGPLDVAQGGRTRPGQGDGVSGDSRHSNLQVVELATTVTLHDQRNSESAGAARVRACHQCGDTSRSGASRRWIRPRPPPPGRKDTGAVGVARSQGA